MKIESFIWFVVPTVTLRHSKPAEESIQLPPRSTDSHRVTLNAVPTSRDGVEGSIKITTAEGGLNNFDI